MVRHRENHASASAFRGKGLSRLLGLITVVTLIASACGGSSSESKETIATSTTVALTTTTVDPIDAANTAGYVALCNDGNFSDNTDFAATCSGGDGIDRWLSEYGECSNGSSIKMASGAACPSGSQFVGLRPSDFEPADITIPDVTGLPLIEAISTIRRLGLEVEAKDAVEDRSILVQGNWQVVRQTPVPGSVVPFGTEVRLGAGKNDDLAVTGGLPLTAENVRQAYAEVFGVAEFSDLCGVSTDFCYITGIETTGTGLIFTMQIDDKDKALGEEIARRTFGLLGGRFPRLSYIQVNNAVGQVLANVTCSEVFGPDKCP